MKPLANVKTLAILNLVLAGVLVSGCSASINGLNVDIVRGSGTVVTESRNVSNFSSVTFAGLGDVTITQGNTESLTIEAEDNIMPHITTNVQGGVLTIGVDRQNFQNLFLPTKPIKFNLNVKSLSTLSVTGAGNVQMAALKTDDLTIKLSGAGNIKIDSLQANSVTTDITGAGNVELGGQVTKQDSTSSGIGNYNSGNMSSKTASVSIKGAGGATVWATDSLTVTISGAGTVSYYGSPTVSKNISGVGSVKSLGNK